MTWSMSPSSSKGTKALGVRKRAYQAMEGQGQEGLRVVIVIMRLCYTRRSTAAIDVGHVCGEPRTGPVAAARGGRGSHERLEALPPSRFHAAINSANDPCPVFSRLPESLAHGVDRACHCSAWVLY